MCKSILTLVLALVLLAWAPARADHRTGTVTVYNNSDHEIYVVIGGYNQGRVWKGSTHTFEFELGYHKVEAWVGDACAKQYVTLTKNEPEDHVTFSNGDF